jgi:hypothetical protein
MTFQNAAVKIIDPLKEQIKMKTRGRKIQIP